MAEPPALRRLRRLVTALTVTLIVGVIIVVATLVIRLGSIGSAPPLPADLSLSSGERAAAVTMGTGWVAVVTEDRSGTERIRVFDATTGAETAVLEISTP